jgi:exonuclease III
VNKSVNKLVELQNIVCTSESDIVGISETWLNSNVSDNEILSDSYNIYRRDRDSNCVQSRGGGVLIAVKKEIKSSLVFSSESKEILAIEVNCTSANNLLLVICYRPPGSDTTQFVNEFYSVLSEQSRKYRLMCIIGDFNFPGIT